MDIRAKAHEISEEMLGWRRDFHAHPELSNNEFRTTEKIVELLKSFGCDSVERPLPTGAVALIKGGKPGKCVALRADIDALPVKEETGLDEAIDEFNKTSRDLERTFKEADPRPDLKKARDDVKGALEDASKAAEKTLKDQPQQEE